MAPEPKITKTDVDYRPQLQNQPPVTFVDNNPAALLGEALANAARAVEEANAAK